MKIVKKTVQVLISVYIFSCMATYSDLAIFIDTLEGEAHVIEENSGIPIITATLKAAFIENAYPILASASLWKSYQVHFKDETEHIFDVNQWVIKKVDDFFLFLPKKIYSHAHNLNAYIADKNITPLEDQIGLKINHFPLADLLGKSDLISNPSGIIEVFRKLFVTITQTHDPHTWNLFINGHGVRGELAGVSIKDFGRLLDFCAHNLSVDHVIYNSCYAGGINRITAFQTQEHMLNDTLSTVRHKSYPFTILSFSPVDEPTESSGSDLDYKHMQKLNIFFQGLHNKKSKVDYYTLAKKSDLLGIFEADFNDLSVLEGALTKNKVRYYNNPNWDKIVPYLKRFLPADDPNLRLLNVVNLPLIRLPYQTSFAIKPILEWSKSPDIVIVPELKSTFNLLKMPIEVSPVAQAIVINTNYIPQPIIIKGPTPFIPKIIAIPLEKSYYFDSIDGSDDLTIKDFFTMFSLMPDKARIFIKKLVLKNDPQFVLATEYAYKRLSNVIPVNNEKITLSDVHLTIFRLDEKVFYGATRKVSDKSVPGGWKIENIPYKEPKKAILCFSGSADRVLEIVEIFDNWPTLNDENDLLESVQNKFFSFTCPSPVDYGTCFENVMRSAMGKFYVPFDITLSERRYKDALILKNNLEYFLGRHSKKRKPGENEKAPQEDEPNFDVNQFLNPDYFGES